MIIVDNALRKRAEEGRPVRVAILGAGFMCQGLANQIVNSVPGMRLVAIYNRRGERAKDVWAYTGRTDAVEADTAKAFEDAASAGKPITAIAHDFTLQPGVPLITVGQTTCSGGASRWWYRR